MFGIFELIIIILIICYIVFGSEILSTVGKSLGKSFNDFKKNLEMCSQKETIKTTIKTGDIKGEKILVGINSKIISITNVSDSKYSLDGLVDEPIKVFISSNNDMFNERNSAKKAIEVFQGLTKYWILDLTASAARKDLDRNNYIQNCDIFITLLNRYPNEEVKKEINIAKKHKIENCFCFLMADGFENENPKGLLKENFVDVFFYKDVEDLELKIKRNLVELLIQSVRKNNRYNLKKSDLKKLLKLAIALNITVETFKYLYNLVDQPIDDKDITLQINSGSNPLHPLLNMNEPKAEKESSSKPILIFDNPLKRLSRQSYWQQRWKKLFKINEKSNKK